MGLHRNLETLNKIHSAIIDRISISGNEMDALLMIVFDIAENLFP